MQPLGRFLARHSQQLGGEQLVRRQVCLDWGEHNAAGEGDEGQGWYAGRLVAYDPDTGEFTVSSGRCGLSCWCRK
jgi:Tfp pilus assembly protein FimT